jgi:hypothetical protein
MKPGRNDSCPCGSGEKYKKCCGRVIPLAPTLRECGTCTACCEGWLVCTVLGQEIVPGNPCRHASKAGCGVYADRPQSPCRNFVCAWMLPDSPFPEGFRPDRLGVIVVPVKWREQPAYLLRSAGRDPDPDLLSWMQRFSMQTGQPFFYEVAGEKLGFGPPLFQKDMLERAERGEPMW